MDITQNIHDTVVMRQLSGVATTIIRIVQSQNDLNQVRLEIGNAHEYAGNRHQVNTATDRYHQWTYVSIHIDIMSTCQYGYNHRVHLSNRP
jgi:hypothetical protein